MESFPTHFVIMEIRFSVKASNVTLQDCFCCYLHCFDLDCTKINNVAGELLVNRELP